MVKSQRSSASSATRKKHARKAAVAAGEVVENPSVPKQKKPRGKEKAKIKAEPRKKVYIPPVRPRAIQPDPLDTLEIAYSISSELLVVLRKLGKKDPVTKIRALEELQSDWVLKTEETNDSQLLEEIVTVLPVWLHHVPGLFLHHSRRIRLLSGELHALLLTLPGIKTQLFALIRDLEEERQETVIGSWCLIIHDIESQVSSAALPSWEGNFGPGVDPGSEGALFIREITPALISFIRQTIFDPLGVYTVVNPIQPSIDTKPAKKGTRLQPRVQEPPEPSADAEPEAERRARLRAGGLGSMKYILAARNLLQLSESSQEAIEETLSSSLLWTSLHCKEQPPSHDSECFGFDQPIVRRAAWGLLLSIMQERKGELDAFLTTLSISVLRSAWVEWDLVVRTSMWQPLLKFVTEYPQCWGLDAHFLPEGDRSESEGEVDPTLPPSVAYKDLLRFLELGCRGSPKQGYPVLVVVLSTIPHPIITSLQSKSPLDDLFVSIWSAIDSRAFGMTDKSQIFSAFAHALVDCLLLFSKRLRNSTDDVVRSLMGGYPETEEMDFEYSSSIALPNFVRKQTALLVEEIFRGRLRLGPPAAIGPLSDLVTKLDEMDKALSKTAWDCVSSGYVQLLQGTFQSFDIRYFSYLEELRNSAAGMLFEGPVQLLIRQTFAVVIGAISKDFDAPSDHRADYLKAGAILKELLDIWGDIGFEDPEISALLRGFMEEGLSQVVHCGPLLVSAYLGLLSEEVGNIYWHRVLDVIVSFTTTEALDWLDKFNNANAPQYLQPSQDLEEFVKDIITAGLEDGADHLKRAISLFVRSDRLVAQDFLRSPFRSVSESLISLIQETLSDASVPLVRIEKHLIFLESTIFRYLDDESLWDVYQSLLPEIFLLGSLINENAEDSSSVSSMCRNIWSGFLTQGSENLYALVKSILQVRLLFYVENVGSWPRPAMVFKAASKLSGKMSLGIMDLVPSREKLDSMLSVFPTEPVDASLSLRSPLLPLSALEDPPLVATENYDLYGYSSYARVISLLLDAFLEDRIVAKAHPWALRHFVALAIYAEEVLDLPNGSSEVFDGKTVSSTALQQLMRKVQQVTAFVLWDVGDGQNWHKRVTTACLDTKVQPDDGEIGKFVTTLLRSAALDDNARDARILHAILQHILGHTSKEEGDLWMGVCRKIESKSPFASMAVALSVADSGSEPLRLSRYRNELAANAMGVRPTKINTEGLWVLRRLVVTAPDPDSDIVFIPQTRAVNFMKACQQWVTSDEEIDEEVETQMTILFFHLAPILQHVPGSHWDFTFDVIENNLENFAVEEPSTIVTLVRSLQAILKIIDLTTTNRALRANWETRRDKILTLVRDIVTSESSVRTGPLSTCRELLLTVTQNLPPSLIEVDTLGKATHLLNDKSTEVQKMAYQLLHESAKKRTEYMVIEAGVSVPDSDSINPELPPELIAFLQKSIDEEDPDAPPTFGYLLGWMSVFDLFVDASLKVKIAYMNHLRTLEMITSHFLPAAFRMFDLYSGVANAPKLDVWGINEYYVPHYEEQNPLSVVLLCAHLYYRALQTVPTLVRLWILECKDRRLSAAVTTYTSKYFSSVLIDTELERVTSSRLGDEKMDVKVISVHREVNTTYTVDENEIKMSLKIPSDWPLHVIEVRGVKKIGVKEDRWMSWISGVRQVVLTQGSVVDGLELFKKNVSAHFANQTECAICYSLISAADGNLPNKPCQTCKNSFHASCLYEWFKSSHSSSCPLCRSNIIR